MKLLLLGIYMYVFKALIFTFIKNVREKNILENVEQDYKSVINIQ